MICFPSGHRDNVCNGLWQSCCTMSSSGSSGQVEGGEKHEIYAAKFGGHLFTTRKRSLGQGNIFTPVCHSVHRGACMVAPGGVCMVAPGGMHGCSGGACVVLFEGGMHGFSRGACVVLFGGHAWFYLGCGGVHGFIQGACMVLFGGVCVVFSVFSDTMRYGQ